MPTVSIGLPVYNGERTLPAALESVAAQTFDDFEVVICDNDSTDRTEEICRAWEARDPRFRYLKNEKNLGAAANFNRTFEQSSGEYFKWLAADDTIEPEYLRASVETFRQAPDRVVMCFPRRRFLNPDGSAAGDCTFEAPRRVASADGRDIRRLVYRDLLQLKDSCAPAIIFGLARRSVLRRTALFQPYNGADLVLYAELALYGELWQLPERLHNQRVHAIDSARARMKGDSEARWYGARRGARNYALHLLREHARAIARAEIPAHEKLLRLVDLSVLPPIRMRMALRRARCDARVAAVSQLSGGSEPRMRALWAWMTIGRLRKKNPLRWKSELGEVMGASDTDVLEYFIKACIDTGSLEGILLALSWLEGDEPRKTEASSRAVRARPQRFHALERRDFTPTSHRALDRALGSAAPIGSE